MINRVTRRLKRYVSLSQWEDLSWFSIRRQRVSMSLARGAATSSLRQIDPANPLSWGFCAFSQNNEDGITDYLTRQIKRPNRYFIEIGAADGLENNTAWLAIALRHSGLMIEGNQAYSAVCQQMISGPGGLNNHVESICMFVTKESIDQLGRKAIFNNPDFFSVDIDGNDYYIAQTIMDYGFRPKIFVVEYNSAFGPTESRTIKYKDDFTVDQEQFLYYGVSITGWKNFFKRYGYQFVTVEENGVNAFFIDPGEFDDEFVKKLKGLDYGENVYQMRRLKVSWEKQYEMIKNLDFVEIK